MQEPGLSIKSDELPFVREMFERIAPRYDFLNRLLSLRRDVVWRRALIAALGLPPAGWALDAACGTGDVALALAREGSADRRVVGADFAVTMLRLADQKIRAAGQRERVTLVGADLLNMPFGPALFDGVAIAFGIRNIRNKSAILSLFYEILKPGGRLAVLELVTPPGGVWRSVYLFYFNHFLPLIGRLFSHHLFAYNYLPDSVAHFPTVDRFAALLRQAGFRRIRYRLLSMGIAALFVSEKPR